MSNTGYKCISRTQDGRLLINVGWNGFVRRSSVRINEYPDQGDAYIEAMRIRERFERELGKPRTERRILGNAVGVMQTKDGHGNESWMARINPRYGKQLRRHFSIKKYGSLKAFEMACDIREQWEKIFYGIDANHVEQD